MRRLSVFMGGFIATLALIGSGLASAHVVVSPKEVGVGKFQTFTVSVPNEKEIPTTALRIAVPDGVKHVTPTVKAGWTINTTKTGTGEEAVVTEINWTGGSISAGLRDDFTFSAQVPTSATTLQWKAYQTYEDGTVVSWDQSGEAEGENVGPLSETKVVNDLTTTPPATTTAPVKRDVLLYAGVGVAILLAGTALIKKQR